MRNPVIFKQAIATYHQATDQWRNSPAGQACWLDIWRHAPPEFRQLAADEAQRCGLLPKPAGFGTDGQPVFRLSDVLAKTGSTLDDFQQFLSETGINPDEFGQVTGPVHTIH